MICGCGQAGPTAAIVNMTVPDNVTWSDAFQFGDADDTTWDFSGQNFKMDIKASRDDTTVLFSLTSAAGRIVVDSVSLRVLHFNVTGSLIVSNVPPATYVYDLVMFDNSVPPIEVALMLGEVTTTHGVTQS
jgi:hypothetical protein